MSRVDDGHGLTGPSPEAARAAEALAAHIAESASAPDVPRLAHLLLSVMASDQEPGGQGRHLRDAHSNVPTYILALVETLAALVHPVLSPEGPERRAEYLAVGLLLGAAFNRRRTAEEGGDLATAAPGGHA